MRRASSQKRTVRRLYVKSLRLSTTFTTGTLYIGVSLIDPFPSSDSLLILDRRSETRKPPLRLKGRRLSSSPGRLWYCENAREEGRSPHNNGWFIWLCCTRGHAEARSWKARRHVVIGCHHIYFAMRLFTFQIRRHDGIDRRGSNQERHLPREILEGRQRGCEELHQGSFDT